MNHKSSTSRAGSSRLSFTRTRKVTASLPSIGGISHHWSENTSDEDLVLGAQVFADAIADVLKG